MSMWVQSIMQGQRVNLLMLESLERLDGGGIINILDGLESKIGVP